MNTGRDEGAVDKRIDERRSVFGAFVGSSTKNMARPTPENRVALPDLTGEILNVVNQLGPPPTPDLGQSQMANLNINDHMLRDDINAAKEDGVQQVEHDRLVDEVLKSPLIVSDNQPQEPLMHVDGPVLQAVEHVTPPKTPWALPSFDFIVSHQDRQTSKSLVDQHQRRQAVFSGFHVPVPLALRRAEWHNLARFFIIRSFNAENVEMAQKFDVWETWRDKSRVLDEAFHSSTEVLLFFSVNGSSGFQGMCRMVSGIGSAEFQRWIGVNPRRLGGAFRLQWITKCGVPFSKVRDLRNRMNNDKSVCSSRDCQEISFEAGEAMREIFLRSRGRR